MAPNWYKCADSKIGRFQPSGSPGRPGHHAPALWLLARSDASGQGNKSIARRRQQAKVGDPGTAKDRCLTLVGSAHDHGRECT